MKRGQYWIGKKHTKETKQKISDNRKGKTAKEKHHFWGKKQDPETIKKIKATLIYKYETGLIKHWNKGSHKYGYKDFKEEVKEKFSHTCGLCKKVGGYFEIDHIIPKKERPDLLMDLSNVRLLCVDCHKRVTFGWKPEVDFRKSFTKEVIKLAETDKRIIFNTCDVGFSFLEEFKEKYPDRYFNFGVTEQSTAIISSAMALSGLRPIFYSMINFVLYRPFEMIRNGIIMHNSPVILAGVQGSTKYKMLGFSHTSRKNEDVDLLWRYPNIRIYIPLDELEIPAMVERMFRENYPAYIRL